MTERDAIRNALLQAPRHRREQLMNLVSDGRLIGFEQAPDDGEPLVVVCSAHHGGITGAKQERCGCGALVWISPSTQAMLAARTSPSTLLCMECSIRTFEAMRSAVPV